MTTLTSTPVTVPAKISDLVDDLTGFHPALDRLVAAFEDVITADLTADQSMAAVAVLGGLADGNAATLLGLVLQHIANPDTNPALADLPAARKRKLRRLGSEYCAQIADDYLTDTAAEASAAIEGS